MLFNSYLFLLIFLPIALVGHYASAAINLKLAAIWLCFMSFVFYGWWNPQFVALLLVSIAFNFAASLLIIHFSDKKKLQKIFTGFSVLINLAVLFHYKYFTALFNFLSEFGLTAGGMHELILPLGISFFTFTQIGYLLDCYSGIVKERSLLSYVLFVTFFPHLIAGPILHHKEMMPQFSDKDNYKFRAENISIGAFLFIIGLCKKVLIADELAPYADAGFSETGSLQFWSSWSTSISYALQLYFDFSGYSDMALGLAKMFGIKFPLNFNSPYKASSIIDFWSRWHMTLTRYLTAYLYYPAAMAISRFRENRGLTVGSHAAKTIGGFIATIVTPTVYTMGLAGIWHGAGFQYLIFGLLHAFYLSVNHAWRIFYVNKIPAAKRKNSKIWTIASVLITFIAVLVGQTFFRANGVADAVELLKGMVGVRGFENFESLTYLSELDFIDAWRVLVGHHLQFFLIMLALSIAWFAPNAHEILGKYSPAMFKVQVAKPSWMQWSPSLGWTVCALLLLCACLANLHKETRFLYFQF